MTLELRDAVRLMIRDEYEVIPLEGETVLVRSPDRGVRVAVDGLQAEELARILRSLDGCRTFGTVRSYGSGFVRLLRELVTREIVMLEPGRSSSRPDVRYFACTHDDPQGCRDRLTASRVLVCGDAELTKRVQRDLAEAGVSRVVVVDEPGETSTARHETVSGFLASMAEASREKGASEVDLAIACLDTPRDPLGEVVSRAARSMSLPWLRLLVFGSDGFVGPLFLPSDGPCLTCLQTRELANWSDPSLTELYYERLTGGRGPGATLPGFAALVSQWGVLEAAKFLARFRAPAVLGAMLCIDFARAEAETRRVLRVPRCRCCSPVAHRPPVDGQLFARAG